MARSLSDPRVRRRGHNEGSIYKDEAKGRWYAAVSFGYGSDGTIWRRVKVSGRTRAEVVRKLKELQAEHDLGAEPVAGYTVRQAIDDWLSDGLEGRSARTIQLPSTVGALRMVPKLTRRSPEPRSQLIPEFTGSPGRCSGRALDGGTAGQRAAVSCSRCPGSRPRGGRLAIRAPNSGPGRRGAPISVTR